MIVSYLLVCAGANAGAAAHSKLRHVRGSVHAGFSRQVVVVLQSVYKIIFILKTTVITCRHLLRNLQVLGLEGRNDDHLVGVCERPYLLKPSAPGSAAASKLQQDFFCFFGQVC